MRRRRFFAVTAFALASAFALLLGEIAVRAFGLDERFLEKYLYLQGGMFEIHQPDNNPKLLFRLKQGSLDYNHFKASVNRHLARGKEYEKEKPPGVYRIITLGGSNVFGAEINDDETWPARVEQKLRTLTDTPIEVWNYGTSAYVSIQMVEIARLTIDELAPDLYVFAFSNVGAPGFQARMPKLQIFNANPSLWFDYVFDPGIIHIPGIWEENETLAAVRRSRLFRYALMGAVMHADPRRWQAIDYEERAIRDFRAFVEEYRDRVKIAVFICPAAGLQMFEPYWAGLDLPVYVLTADGMPREYIRIHPPAYVMPWYADHLAPWLIDRGLAPGPSSSGGEE